MLSSHLTSVLALTGFALTSTVSAAVLAPRAAGVCQDGLLYTSPQCCDPGELECTVREFISLLFLSPRLMRAHTLTTDALPVHDTS